MSSHDPLAGYQSEPDTALKLNQSVRTLRKWRQIGQGPAWTKFGRLIYYRDAAIDEWLKSLERRPVRSRAQHRAGAQAA
jgi:Helix-turn-helix domain